MKRPKWATIVGILGIVFGCSGILGGTQQLVMPKILKMQFSKMAKDSVKHRIDSPSPDGRMSDESKNSRQSAASEASGPFQKTFKIPPWYGTWSTLSGIMRVCISALYLFAAIWLLLTKPSSIRLFYCAAGASVGLSIVQGIIIFSITFLASVAVAAAGTLSIPIDVALITVVAIGDKSAYYPPPVQQTSSGESR